MLTARNTCVWADWGECFTWSQLFDAPVAAADVHRQEVFEPVDLRVGVSAGRTQHRGRARPFHNLQLGPHVDGGEAVWDLVLCGKETRQTHISGGRDTEETQAGFSLLVPQTFSL